MADRSSNIHEDCLAQQSEREVSTDKKPRKKSDGWRREDGVSFIEKYRDIRI